MTAWQHLDFDQADDEPADFAIDGLINLLGELGPIPAWTRDALCAEPAYRDVPFFPEKGQTSEEAAKVCGRCLCAAECAAYAKAQGAKSGVWAGVNYGNRSRKAA